MEDFGGRIPWFSGKWGGGIGGEGVSVVADRV